MAFREALNGSFSRFIVDESQLSKACSCFKDGDLNFPIESVIFVKLSQHLLFLLRDVHILLNVKLIVSISLNLF